MPPDSRPLRRRAIRSRVRMETSVPKILLLAVEAGAKLLFT